MYVWRNLLITMRRSTRDSYKYKGLRLRMVKDLMAKGIKEVKVLQVMLDLPRHFFIEIGFEDWAYKDQAFSIPSEQTISRPYTVALQTSLLELKDSDTVLEIGTGSGYQCAVLSRLVNRVYTIERHDTLFKLSNQIFQELSLFNIRNYHGDGYAGLPLKAPFDKIIVTAGANHIPNTLVDQLAKGGRMVIPIGDEENQEMLILNKDMDGNITQHSAGKCEFVPFLQGKVGILD